MKRIVSTFVFGVCIFVCVGSAILFAAPQIPGPSAAQSDTPLANLSEISVEVLVTPPDDTKSPHLATLLRTPSLLPSSLQTKIELEIRRSTNLRIVPNALAKLRATIAVTDVAGGDERVRAYYCIVSLFIVELMRIVRNGVFVTEKSWESDAYHSWGGDDSVITNLNSKLDIPLNEFLNRYLAENPRK